MNTNDRYNIGYNNEISNKSFVRKLTEMEACGGAVDWVREHGGTSSECWRDCERGDWMAWLAAKTPSITRRQLVGALADCAELSLQYFEAEYPDDKRVRECIDTCRRYAQGKATEEELELSAYSAAASATYAASYAAASYAASAAAASYTAYASAYATYAASAAAASYAASAAASAAAASYAASAAAYANADRGKTLKKCADIMRKHFPNLLDKE
jgi:hypothetical protein